ncbi:hypothetical protein L1887_34306 [Cichorium endivia]|nr:hypothetical protein L1887_34306 [Cichorium endivia]
MPQANTWSLRFLLPTLSITAIVQPSLPRIQHNSDPSKEKQSKKVKEEVAGNKDCKGQLFGYYKHGNGA